MYRICSIIKQEVPLLETLFLSMPIPLSHPSLYSKIPFLKWSLKKVE